MPNTIINHYHGYIKEIYSLLLLALLLLPGLGFAQNINTEENFPDPNFRTAVEEFMGVAPGGSFTASQAAFKYGLFDCSNRNISNLQGIAFFRRITVLDCGDNLLTSLDVSSNDFLLNLFCDNNQLTSLNFTNNPRLYYVLCSNNSLTTLDVTNLPALLNLYCENNQLASLDISNNPLLQYFVCSRNQLVYLDVSNNPDLVYLRSRYNQISSISSFVTNPGINAGDIIDIRNNNLDLLDWFDVAALIDRVGSGFSYSPQNGFNPYVENINSPARFPDPNFRAAVESFMGIAPGEGFTATQASQKTGILNCAGMNISSLQGIEYFINITVLYCQNNLLTELDVSANSALLNVFCQNNQLTSLHLGDNPKLFYVVCEDNQLTDLDVANLPALRYLYCKNNQLVSLNVSTNNQLEYLYCQNNQLESVASLAANSGLAAGDRVDIRNNNLDLLDWFDVAVLIDRIGSTFNYSPQRNFNPYVENINSPLRFPDPNFRAFVESFMGVAPSEGFTATQASQKTGILNCAGMSISSLQGIEYFKNITVLNCQNNLLTGLNVSSNSALLNVFCQNNLLTSLHLGDNPRLFYVVCDDNQLADLDVANLSALRYLYCKNNQLVSLNVSTNNQLEYLYCQNNQLESVASLAANTGLAAGDRVDVRNNNLDLLDWFDVAVLIDRIGSTFNYSPQRNFNPYVENINSPTNFPDPNFRAAVEAFMEVAPGAGFTATQAARKIGTFNCAGMNVSSLQGIEYFKSITVLNCQNNLLTGLDVSSNPALLNVFCQNNQLTNLNLGNNPNLYYVVCEGNQLSSLDISGLPNLRYLYTKNNLLPVLDISNNVALQYLFCQNNLLTSLDVAANVNLFYLYCQSNQLSDLSSFVANEGLGQGDFVDVRFNQFTENDLNDIATLQQRIGVGFRYSITDTQAPVIETPADMTVEGTSPQGAVVYFEMPAAIDSIDPSPTVACSPSSGSTFPLGNTVVTCTATDSSGNSSSVTFTISVVDTTPPEIILAIPDSLVLEINVDSYDESLWQAQAVDACDPNVSVEIYDDDVNGATLGSYNVTFMAIDNSGNSADISRTVIFRDTLPPSFTPPGNIVVEGEGSDGTIVAYDIPVASDLYDFNPIVVCVPPPNSLFPLGETIVSCTAFDQEGNSSAVQTFSIQVLDRTSPVIASVYPDILYLEAKVDTYSESVWQISITDICDPDVAVQIGGDVVNSNEVGSYSVHFDAEDDSGNSAVTVIREVIVRDTTPPWILLSGPASLVLEVNVDTYTESVWQAIATDLCDPNVQVIVGGDTVNAAQLGTYTVTFDAVDIYGNSAAQQTRSVQVRDTLPPSFTPPDNMVVEGEGPAGSIVAYDIPIATDLYDPAPTMECVPQPNSLFPLGETIVSCTATDNQGNTAVQTFSIQVLDRTPPVISVANPDTIYLEAKVDTYSESIWQISVTDLCDPDVAVQIGGDVVNPNEVGSYLVLFDAQDDSGNSAVTAIREVVVRDTTSPQIVINGPASLMLEINLDIYSELVWQASATDLCDPNVLVVIGGEPVNISQLGTYTVTFDAVDMYGNPAIQQTRTVEVIDTRPPVISGLENITMQQDPGCPAQTLVPMSVSVSDLGDPAPTVTTVFDYADGSQFIRQGLPLATESFPIGTSQVTVTATDHRFNQFVQSVYVYIASRTKVNVTVTRRINRVNVPQEGVEVRVYDFSFGLCADMVDGVAGNGLKAQNYKYAYFDCPSYYWGITDANGNTQIGVLPGKYLVIVGLDTNNNGVIDLFDTFKGYIINNIQCGATQNISFYF